MLKSLGRLLNIIGVLIATFISANCLANTFQTQKNNPQKLRQICDVTSGASINKTASIAGISTPALTAMNKAYAREDAPLLNASEFERAWQVGYLYASTFEATIPTMMSGNDERKRKFFNEISTRAGTWCDQFPKNVVSTNDNSLIPTIKASWPGLMSYIEETQRASVEELTQCSGFYSALAEYIRLLEITSSGPYKEYSQLNLSEATKLASLQGLNTENIKHSLDKIIPTEMDIMLNADFTNEQWLDHIESKGKYCLKKRG